MSKLATSIGIIVLALAITVAALGLAGVQTVGWVPPTATLTVTGSSTTQTTTVAATTTSQVASYTTYSSSSNTMDIATLCKLYEQQFGVTYCPFVRQQWLSLFPSGNSYLVMDSRGVAAIVAVFAATSIVLGLVWTLRNRNHS